jgi:peptide/nickel transport system substrate-binding protein
MAPAGQRHPWTKPHVLRMADSGDVHTLNPYLTNLDLNAAIASLIYSFLIVADDRGRLIGDLSVSVPTVRNGGISRDGRTYVYRLRRGVKWQDGAAFTARDVIASWRAIMDPHNDVENREGYDRVVSIEAPNPYTIVVRLRERYPPFVSRFFTPLQEYARPVLPAHVLAKERDFNTGDLNSRPVGTGPFRLVSWTRGERLVFERFDAYFRGRPKLQRIELSIVPDGQAIANEMRAHRIDLIVYPQIPLIDEYKTIGGVVVNTVPSDRLTDLILNDARGPLSDVDVRRAIAAAIPYREIIDKVTHGVYGEVRSPLLPGTIGYVPFKPREQNLALANALLDRDGWRRAADGIRGRRGERLSLDVASIQGVATADRIALLLQSSLHAAGIELRIKDYPVGRLFAPDGPIYGGTYDTAIDGEVLDWDPDAYDFWACDRWYPRGANVYRFCDPRVDALERRGATTDDTAVRAHIYRRASVIVWSDVPYVPLFAPRLPVVRSSDLRDYRPSATGSPWWNAWQWDI